MKLGWACMLLEPLSSQPAAGRGAATAPDAVGWSGIALLLVGVTLLHLALVWMERRGWMAYPARRMGRGLGQAVMTFGHFLQPNVPPPEDRPGHIELREDDEAGRSPGLDGAPVLFEDGRWPEDGLRTRPEAARDGSEPVL